jgi:hypothetical protein
VAVADIFVVFARSPARTDDDKQNLFERAAGERGKLARDAVRSLPGDRQFALALEFFDRRPGLAVD